MAYLGRQKGIVDDHACKSNSKKKKKQEEKRVRDLVEFQLEQDRKKLQQEKLQYDQKIEYLHSMLYEEQQRNTDLTEDLNKYKQAMGEVCEQFGNFGLKFIKFCKFQLPDQDFNPRERERRVPRRRQHMMLMNNENDDALS